jgi:hypothetical protein
MRNKIPKSHHKNPQKNYDKSLIIVAHKNMKKQKKFQFHIF